MTTEFNGLELKLLRQFNELSLEDLGSKLDCDYTRQYLHKVETGQTLPNDQFIDKVAHYFNVSQSFFMQQKPVLQEDQFHQKQRDRQICLQPQVQEDMLRQKQQNRLYSC